MSRLLLVKFVITLSSSHSTMNLFLVSAASLIFFFFLLSRLPINHTAPIFTCFVVLFTFMLTNNLTLVQITLFFFSPMRELFACETLDSLTTYSILSFYLHACFCLSLSLVFSSLASYFHSPLRGSLSVPAASHTTQDTWRCFLSLLTPLTSPHVNVVKSFSLSLLYN